MKKKAKAKEFNPSWWKIPLSIAMVVVGVGVAYFGQTQRNQAIIILGGLLMIGGVFLFLSMREELGARILPGKKLKHPANSLIVYPNDIEFDYIKKPPGHQQRCINDGKWYHVLVKKQGESLKEYLLPDEEEKERYYDPAEFSNPVTMPANAKLFEPRPSLAKTITVGIMGAVVAVLAIVIVAMSGG
jgi:hypothetical protein